MAKNAEKELNAILWKVNMEQQLMGLKSSAEIGEKLEQLFNEQKTMLIEKATEWLTYNWRKYIDTDADGMIRFAGWKNDFVKAMTDEA